MSVASRYRQAWEGFWSEAPEERGAVFWDAEPTLTAARHLALFEPHLTDAQLPLIDLGCGNGTQTRFLADRFPHVVGADLAGAALDRARRADPDGRAAYRQLDAADKAEVEALHAELGDANVYLRGVLHQSAAEDRQPLADGLAVLLGTRAGRCWWSRRRPPNPSWRDWPRAPTGRRPSWRPSSGTASHPPRPPTAPSRTICGRPV